VNWRPWQKGQHQGRGIAPNKFEPVKLDDVAEAAVVGEAGNWAGDGDEEE